MERFKIIAQEFKTLLDEKKYDTVVEKADQLIGSNASPDIVSLAWYSKSYIHYPRKEYREAIRCIDKAIELDPQSAVLWNYKGHCYTLLGEHELATSLYNQAIQLDDQFALPWINKANREVELDKLDSAIAYYNKAIAIEPMNAIALNNKGVLLDKMGEFEGAAQCLLDGGHSIIEIISASDIEESTKKEFIKLDPYFRELVLKDKEHTKHLEFYQNIYLQSIRTVGLLCVDGDMQEENDVAHYTSVDVAKQLLTEPSPLRLCSIATANDPTEGNALLCYLGISRPNEQRKIENNTYDAFITCFTFDHDCLNQFRLYGKDGSQDAVGLSLVLGMEYFSPEAKLDTPSSGKTSGLLSSNSSDKPVERNVDNNNIELPQHALYRCIYIDPYTAYVASLGRREDYTFYREYHVGEEGERKSEEKVGKIVEFYNELYEYLLKKVRAHLEELYKQIQDLKLALGDDWEKNTGLVEGLLIHLRYLVKDVAFMEERECRMIAIESLSSTRVKQDEKTEKFYIEAPIIVKNLKKIYFAPKTGDIGKFQDLLAHKGISTKYKESKHPYR